MIKDLRKRITNRVINSIAYMRMPLYRFKYKRSHNKYKLGHVTIYSTTNTGDTVLSTCIRDLFDSHVGNISWELTHLFSEVNDSYIERLNKCDGLIVGGHGAFIPDTHPNKISGWEWACSIEQYKKIEAPLIIFAIGYNYFYGQKRQRLFEENIEALVRKSSFFGLRNRGSVREIQSFIPDDIKDKVIYQPCPTMIARYIYPNLPQKRDTKRIAFNVALDRAERRMGDNKDLILSQIAESMYRLYQRGYEIHFIAHMLTEVPFRNYLDKFNFPYKFHPAMLWNTQKAIKFYNKMDVIVGMRGHGIWIPFGVNCQIISLGNQNKTKWFLEDIDALDWFININSDPKHLCDKIIYKFIEIHEENGNETIERLLNAQKKLYDITMANLEKIKIILNKKYRGGYKRQKQTTFIFVLDSNALYAALQEEGRAA